MFLSLFAKKTNQQQNNQTKLKNTPLIDLLLCWSANSDYKAKATVIF